MRNITRSPEYAVQPNSCRIAHGQGNLVARDLSSDLLLVLYAREHKLGMMLRIKEGPDHLRFGESTLRILLSELPSLGIDKNRLTVHAVGGVCNDSGCLTMLVGLLLSEGIRLTGTDLGEDQRRSVLLALDSGRLIVRSAKTSALAHSNRASIPRLAS